MISIALAVAAGCATESPTGTDDDGGGPSGPQPNPDGVLLGGDPGALAISTTRVLPPSPVDASQVIDGRMINRLTAVIAGDATAAEVNAALQANDVRIVTMGVKNLLVSLVTPPQTTQAEADALISALLSSGAFAFVTKAHEWKPEPVPAEEDDKNRIVPPDGYADLQHLIVGYYPAAWNALRLATQNNNRVRVIVPDYYVSASSNSQINTQSFENIGVPAGLNPAANSHDGNHGFHCSGIIGANFDNTGATGTNPDPTLFLDLRSVHVTGLSAVDWLQQIASTFPASGKFVLSTSLGYGGLSQLTKNDFINIAFGALSWRIVTAPFQGRMFHATAAGNEATVGGLRAQASYGSGFAAAAMFDNPRDLIPADSLSATEWQGFDIAWNAMLGQNPAAGSAFDNTLVVGSSGAGGGESFFSNRNPDVRAVGERVLAPCSAQDAGFPANPDLCDGSVARYSGTSMATPTIAGLAAYLWNLDPDLTPSQIRGKIIDAYNGSHYSGVTDAYVAALSLDNSIGDAPVRRSLLDVAGAAADQGSNGVFNEHDIEAFLIWFEHYEIDRDVNGTLDDWSRYDLNGDGLTGGGFKGPFDLNINGYDFDVTGATVCDQTTNYNEGSVSDREILTYYAYSSLYTGDTEARDALLCATNVIEISGLPERISPGEATTVTVRAGERTGTGGTVTYLEGIDVDVRATNGAPTMMSGVTNSQGEFTATFTMRDEDEFSYFNELRIRATGHFTDGDVTNERAAIRPNQIVMTTRSVQVESDIYFFVNPTPAPGADIYINETLDTSWVPTPLTDPVNFSNTFNQTETGEGITANPKMTQSHQSSVSGSVDAFAGASVTAMSTGSITVTNPNFDVDSYVARTDGRTDYSVGFRVYGDPATFNISGSINGSRIYFVWLFGPNDPYECDSFDGCTSIAGSGAIIPGAYNFVVVQRDHNSIQWYEDYTGQNSGTADATGGITATLSVSH